MQRVRMSLPYFIDYNWEAEVVAVDAKYCDLQKDELLLESVPVTAKVHKVRAFSKTWTMKLGLGSIALRSLQFYKKYVNVLLEKEKFDLIYFSTTQFPVCILGAYWKKRYDIPYVIDMQDPWHSDYYQDKPKEQRPPKYWFSYRLNKYLERIAMEKVDGLVAVSESYIDTLRARHSNVQHIPALTITFGFFEKDFEIALHNKSKFKPLLQEGFVNIVYVGRGGMDMHTAIGPVFEAFARGIANENSIFRKIRFYFIGTSYAPAGEGSPTIMPLAEKYGVGDYIIEITDRISYFHSLITLQQSDALFIPGSDDPQYTASKLYPYLALQKPLLAVFNEKSNAVSVLQKCVENAAVFTFNQDKSDMTAAIGQTLRFWAGGVFKPVRFLPGFEKYTARNLTGEQVDLFNNTLKSFEAKNTDA